MTDADHSRKSSLEAVDKDLFGPPLLVRDTGQVASSLLPLRPAVQAGRSRCRHWRIIVSKAVTTTWKGSFEAASAAAGRMLVTLLPGIIPSYVRRTSESGTSWPRPQACIFRVASEAGAKLDSRADLATWGVLPVSVWLLMPDFVEAELGWIALLMATLAATLCVGFLRWGRMPSYHTWGAKASAILLAFSLIAILAGAPIWPIRLAAAFAFLSMMEEMAITAILPRWQTDVPSVWHASQLR